MQIQNVKFYEGLSFEEYRQLPGTSFSWLKGDIEPTESMMLGSRVHNYLLEPETYDWKQAEYVRPIAAAVKKFIGDAYNVMKKEVSFTADFIENEMCLAYKGRADLLKIGHLVADLKILSTDIETACERFGYPEQISGYCIATDSPKGLIIAFNKKKKIIETKIITPSRKFWQYQTVCRGKVLA